MLIKRNVGQDRGFHTEDKASALHVWNLFGVFFVKICMALLSS